MLYFWFKAMKERLLIIARDDCDNKNTRHGTLSKTWSRIFQGVGVHCSSSTEGSQKDMELQADAIIMYLGLNWTHCTGPLWSPLRTQTFGPFSLFQMWMRPSLEPEITNWESGEKDASRGSCLELRWPVNVWRDVPLYESISFITEPLVEIKIDFPSGENLRPVHSISLLSACNLKDEKGPLSKDLRS